MIKIKCFLASFDYQKDNYVEIYFPAVPRVGDFIALSEEKEKELMKMAIADYDTFLCNIGWLCGVEKEYFIATSEANHVRAVDWWASEDGVTMECYIMLDEEGNDKKWASERNYHLEISKEEYLEIKKRTEIYYNL